MYQISFSIVVKVKALNQIDFQVCFNYMCVIECVVLIQICLFLEISILLLIYFLSCFLVHKAPPYVHSHNIEIYVGISQLVSKVTQSCPTLCDLMDCSPPSSSVHGILQAGILELIAISFSRGSFQPSNRTQVSHIAGRHFNLLATREELGIVGIVTLIVSGLKYTN